MKKSSQGSSGSSREKVVKGWIESFLSLFRRKELSGDFSSFTYMCPVRYCCWYFQSEEMRQEHIRKGVHGVEGDDKYEKPN